MFFGGGSGFDEGLLSVFVVEEVSFEEDGVCRRDDVGRDVVWGEV